jgi:hypothetical protein
LISTVCSANTVPAASTRTQFAAPRGVDSGKISGIELQIEAANVVDRLIRNALDAPNPRREKWRLRREMDRNFR